MLGRKIVSFLLLAIMGLGLKAQTTVSMPVLRVSFEGKFNKGMDYVFGHMQLTDTDGSVIELPAKFKTRGATAASYMMKPSFNMKLRTADSSEELDSALLGMRSCSSWILDGMAIDRICMRNRIVSNETKERCERLNTETDENCARKNQETEEYCTNLMNTTEADCKKLKDDTEAECTKLREETLEECEIKKAATREEIRQNRAAVKKEFDSISEYLSNLQNALSDVNSAVDNTKKISESAFSDLSGSQA